MKTPSVIIVIFILAQTVLAGRYALLVGNSTAQGNYAELKYVQNDLAAFKGILSEFCGFEKTGIRTVFNGSPEEIDRALKAIAVEIGSSKNSMLLFYYSGHADQSRLKMGERSYLFDTLRNRIATFPTDIKIAILDACQSGSFVRTKGGKLDEPFLFRDDGKTKGQVILCSSSINENAQESDALGNSVFTFHIVNGLRGSADISGDGRVTLSEAYQYSYSRTISSTAGSSGGIQHPSFQFRIQGEGDITLADLNTRSQGILLGDDVRGDITIVTKSNSIVADLTKDKNRATMIALGPGMYQVFCGIGDNRYQTTALVSERSVARIRQSDFTPVAAQQGRKKGREGHELHFGLSLSGVAGFYDFTTIASGLEDRFSGFRYFAMEPEFSIPSQHGSFCVQGEMRYRQLIGRMGYGSFSSGASSGYRGSSIDAVTGSAYGASLHITQRLRADVVSLGIGYLFEQRFLRNFSLMGGVAFYTIAIEHDASFYDSLYNVTSQTSARNVGVVPVPFGEIGYKWPLTGHVDVGGRVGYRYQKGTAEVSSEWDGSGIYTSTMISENASLRCRLNGLDIGVFAMVHFSTSLWGLFL